MPWYLTMIVRIFPVLLICYGYAGWRISNSVITLFHLPAARVRVALALITLTLLLLPLAILLRRAMGNLEGFFLMQPLINRADYLLTFPFWLGLTALIEMLPYLLATDALSLFFRAVPALAPPKWPHYRAALQLAVAVIIPLYVLPRAYLDTYRVRMTDYRVTVPGLPAELTSLKITLFADLQVDRFTQGEKLRQFQQSLRQADGELLLFAGDLVTFGQDFISQAVSVLCRESAPLARIACLGDHDHWANPARIAGGLQQCGWDFLQNRHRLIDYRGKRILVTGVTYIYSRRMTRKDLQMLLESAPAADLKILLVHQPSRLVIEAAAAAGYHLLLAGHTHGGQIVFRPFGIPLTPTRFENTFYTGFHYFQKLAVIVTNGVGLTLAPIRYQAPAEIVRISLAPAGPETHQP